MLNDYVFLLVAALLATMSPNAHAFFDPPWTTPATARAGEPIFLNIRGGNCDVFVEHPGYPQIYKIGSDIRIVEYGNHETFDDFCTYGIWTLVAPVGTLSPGSYTLTVDFTYENYPFGYEAITLGVLPFTVVGATSVASVPVVSRLGKFLLLVLITGIAVRALRRGDTGNS